MMINDIPR